MLKHPTDGFTPSPCPALTPKTGSTTSNHPLQEGPPRPEREKPRITIGPKTIGRQSGLTEKQGQNHQPQPAVGEPSAARTGPVPAPKPQSAGRAASYKKPIEARCRRALRGPNRRNHPGPIAPKPIGRQSGLTEKQGQNHQPQPAVGEPSAARTIMRIFHKLRLFSEPH